MHVLPGGAEGCDGCAGAGGRGARGAGADGAHLDDELAQELLGEALCKVGGGVGRLEVLLGPLQEEAPDGGPLGGLGPDAGDEGGAGDLARALLDLLHALERLVAEAVDVVL